MKSMKSEENACHNLPWSGSPVYRQKLVRSMAYIFCHAYTHLDFNPVKLFCFFPLKVHPWLKMGRIMWYLLNYGKLQSLLILVLYWMDLILSDCSYFTWKLSCELLPEIYDVDLWGHQLSSFPKPIQVSVMGSLSSIKFYLLSVMWSFSSIKFSSLTLNIQHFLWICHKIWLQ